MTGTQRLNAPMRISGTRYVSGSFRGMEVSYLLPRKMRPGGKRTSPQGR